MRSEIKFECVECGKVYKGLYKPLLNHLAKTKHGKFKMNDSGTFEVLEHDKVM